jgi:hypothetical protein
LYPPGGGGGFGYGYGSAEEDEAIEEVENVLPVLIFPADAAPAVFANQGLYGYVYYFDDEDEDDEEFGPRAMLTDGKAGVPPNVDGGSGISFSTSLFGSGSAMF